MTSKNGRRPAGVRHLSGTNVADMVAQLGYVTGRYSEIKCGLPPENRDANIAKNGGVAAAESRRSGLMNRA